VTFLMCSGGFCLGFRGHLALQAIALSCGRGLAVQPRPRGALLRAHARMQAGALRAPRGAPTRRLCAQVVCEFCERHLTANKAAFVDPRLELIINDAGAALEAFPDGSFDVIIGDLADPVEGGPCYQVPCPMPMLSRSRRAGHDVGGASCQLPQAHRTAGGRAWPDSPRQAPPRRAFTQCCGGAAPGRALGGSRPEPAVHLRGC